MELLAAPERPLLKPWYRLAETQDALLLEHGGTVVRFTGSAARALLPRLLPLLDGTRTTDELIATVGRPVSKAVVQALDLLTEHRLLVEATPVTRSGDAEALAETSGFSVSTVGGRLAAAEVAVVGSPPLADPAARLLHAAGVGSVQPNWTPSTIFTVVLGAREDPSRFDSWNRRALAEGIEWLPAGDFDGATATVGPLVVPHETACHECLAVRRASTSNCARELAALRRVPRACLLPATVETLVVAATAHLVIRWIALRDPALAGTVVTIDASRGIEVSAHTVLRVPRCPSCSPTRSAAPPLPWHEAEPVSG